MLSLETDVAPSLPAGVTVFLALLAAVGGTGGIAALVKIFIDRRQGVEAHEVVEDDAIVARWRELSDAQTKGLRSIIEELRADLEALKREQALMKDELSASRTKYWRAVGYIRTLNLWIVSHIPAGITPPPEPPREIMEDV